MCSIFFAVWTFFHAGHNISETLKTMGWAYTVETVQSCHSGLSLNGEFSSNWQCLVRAIFLLELSSCQSTLLKCMESSQSLPLTRESIFRLRTRANRMTAVWMPSGVLKGCSSLITFEFSMLSTFTLRGGSAEFIFVNENLYCNFYLWKLFVLLYN